MNGVKRIAVAGLGNLGKSVLRGAKRFSDLEISYAFSRRANEISKEGDIYKLPFDRINKYKDEIDCLILCLGSSELSEMGPRLAANFNTVDSFDTHSAIPDYLIKMKESARESHCTSVISSGWDPGLMSLARLYFGAFMPYASVGTLWGPGVSQGHSEVIRRIPGVKKAVQYTIPKESAEEVLRESKPISSRDAHKRKCYVVAEEGREAEIAEAIRGNERYFKGYEVEISFITNEEFEKEHSYLPHAGKVIASGKTDGGDQSAELRLALKSNPDFTAHILLATARAAVRLNEEGSYGAFTPFDLPPRYFFQSSPTILL